MRIASCTDATFGVNTYIIEEKGHTILIDPVMNEYLYELIRGVMIDYAFLTHEHYDHISGVNELKKRYGTTVVCGVKTEERLKDPVQNLSRFQDYIVQVVPFGNGQTSCEEYSCSADQVVTDGQEIIWQGHRLYFKEIPGHSIGSIAVLIDYSSLFSGDSIFQDYPTATRLPGGSTKQFKQITEPWLDSLRQDTMVYPGHGSSFLLKERFKT